MGAVVRMEPVKDPLQRARLTLLGGDTRPWMVYHACEVLAASPFDDDRDRAALCMRALKERLRWDVPHPHPAEPAPAPEGPPAEDGRAGEGDMSLGAASAVAVARLALFFTAGWLIGALWQALS